MALNFDPTKRVKKIESSVKIFEEPVEIKASPSLPQENNLKPKLSHTEAKPEPIHKPELSHTSAKVEPFISHKKNVFDKLEPKPEPIHKPELSHTSAKVEPKFVFEELVGLQRSILISFFEMCVRNGNRITPPVAISNLSNSIETTVSAGRKAIQRLEEKGFIVRAGFKDGRGGWTKYEVKEEVYKTLLLNNTSAKVEPFISQSRAKVATQLEPKPEPNSLYSNNSFIKDNYNTEDHQFEIPENLTALGVGQKQLAVIVRDNFLTTEEVQQSLNHYSHDLAKNLVKTRGANFIFGVMRNKTPYISSHFAQDEAKSIQAEIARIKQIQSDRVELAELQLREQFEDYKLKNPNFLDEVKAGNSFLAKSNSNILNEIAFGKFKEIINSPSQEPTA